MVRAGLRAFSLVEVVVAVGVVAVGVIGVLGLMLSTSRSIAADEARETALLAAERLIARVRSEPWEFVRNALSSRSDLGGNIAGREEPVAERFFANARGEEIGSSTRSSGEALPFYELTLIRNEQLSPSVADPQAAWLAFHVRVRWPVSREGATSAGAHQLLLAGSVRR